MVSRKDLCPRNCEGILSEKRVFDINRLVPQRAAVNHRFVKKKFFFQGNDVGSAINQDSINQDMPVLRAA